MGLIPSYVVPGLVDGMHFIIGAIGFIDAIRHCGVDLMGLIPSYVVPGL
jgi:hypothetical protein